MLIYKPRHFRAPALIEESQALVCSNEVIGRHVVVLADRYPIIQDRCPDVRHVSPEQLERIHKITTERLRLAQEYERVLGETFDSGVPWSPPKE